MPVRRIGSQCNLEGKALLENGLVPNLRLRTALHRGHARRDPVSAIAGRQGTGTRINQVIPANTCPVALSQPPPNSCNSLLLQKLCPFGAPHRSILARENATREAPKNHLWMRLEHSRRCLDLVQFLQFLSNAKQLHRYAATDTLFVPIMQVGFIERSESPYTPTSAKKNARSDDRARLNIALSVPPLGQTDRHVNHGSIVGVRQQSSYRRRVCETLPPVAT
jgi:hypothetical protein